MPKRKNLFIFISDSLRWDYGKKYLKDLPGTLAKGRSEGPHTASALTSIITGKKWEGHEVKGFQEGKLKVPTVFDLEQKGYATSYYDHPDDICYKILNFPPRRSLHTLVDEEKFVYVERECATHVPYSIIFRKEDKEKIKKDIPFGMDYTNLIKEGKVNYKQDYIEGIYISIGRFLNRIKLLLAYDRLKDTFCVFTSDHGDAWPEDVEGEFMDVHNMVCIDNPKVRTVPVLFYNMDIKIKEPLLGRNILRVWDKRWDNTKKDLTTIQRNKKLDEERVKKRLRRLGYV